MEARWDMLSSLLNRLVSIQIRKDNMMITMLMKSILLASDHGKVVRLHADEHLLGNQLKKHCNDAGSNADDNGEDLVDDPSDTLVSSPKTNENIRVIAAPSVYPRDEERQQSLHRVGTVIRSPGMSPESVKVRIDLARSAAQNEMWEKIEKERERRENEERNGLIRAMELQSD